MSDIPNIQLSFEDDGDTGVSEHKEDFLRENGELRYEGVRVDSNGCSFADGTRFGISFKELEVKEIIGKGQFGVVRKAINKITSQVIAVKQIRVDLDPSALKSTFLELKVLTQSNCPNIVGFYGSFFMEGHLYYCMEYMDYGSIDKLITQGIPEPAVAKIVESALNGLIFLKEKLNIMHRDVRPSNILIDSKGNVKLCDFNVSGRLVGSVALTFTGCQKYMPPERILAGVDSPYDSTSDVWSLGLSVIEMATSIFPYKESTMYAQLKQILNEEPPNLPNTFSPEIRDFIARCLKKESKDRHNFRQLLNHDFIKKYSNYDLSEWVCSMPLPSAPSPTTPVQQRK